jgi:hypothetical protein
VKEAKRIQIVYWCFWIAPTYLYLIGLLGHWPLWLEKALDWIGFPWSLVTVPLSVRIETAIGFGLLSFFAQLVLFIAVPAILDYFLVFIPLTYLIGRLRTKDSNAI